MVKGNHGLRKISQTTNPAARLAQLRSASSSPLEFAWVGAPKADVIAIERDAHTMLDKYRRNGEWFEVSPDAAVGAIHSVAYRRGQPVLDLDANQAEQIVQIARQQSDKPSSVLDRIVIGMVQFVLAMIVMGWLVVVLARAVRF